MKYAPRPDDFESRRRHLRPLSDEELHARFWSLVEQIVAPLVEEATTHTSPSIERSVLLRMGLSSVEAKTIVEGMAKRGLLGHGAGKLLLDLAERKGLSIVETGAALAEGRLWEELPR
jgi:D-ornithine 4,5-aminomutase subunit alpha